MIVGVPKEIKVEEYRVGMTPSGVNEFVKAGHMVLTQENAGTGSGVTDDEFRAAGAGIVESASELYARADMIVKVKEPQKSEYEMLRAGQILYAYLHLAPAPELTAALLERNVIGVAYETIELPDGSLPLLAPMSEVAGRMAVQAGAHFLEKTQGGRGVMLGGVPGVSPANVVALGTGVVGSSAIKIAVGMGARVLALGRNLARLTYLDDLYRGRVTTLALNSHTVAESVAEADLVIGGLLAPGALAPKVVTREMIRAMKPGSVIVDVSIDQGGCVETSRPTSHRDPVFVEEGVIHYCVTNIPGIVSRTSTFALTNATVPYGLKLAGGSMEKIVTSDPALALGVNVYKGKVTHPAVARDLGYPYHDVASLV